MIWYDYVCILFCMLIVVGSLKSPWAIVLFSFLAKGGGKNYQCAVILLWDVR